MFFCPFFQEEFEKTLRELQEQVARGETSIAELRQRLLGGEKKEEKQEEKKEEKKVEEVKRTTYRELENLPEIPEELLAVKAYIQWERNGKPNYTQEEETVSLIKPLKPLFCSLFSFFFPHFSSPLF